jgi:hypothetical protein
MQQPPQKPEPEQNGYPLSEALIPLSAVIQRQRRKAIVRLLVTSGIFVIFYALAWALSSIFGVSPGTLVLLVVCATTLFALSGEFYIWWLGVPSYSVEKWRLHRIDGRVNCSSPHGRTSWSEESAAYRFKQVSDYLEQGYGACSFMEVAVSGIGTLSVPITADGFALLSERARSADPDKR